ncbi:AMP-binding protein [Actinacidiphila soli]|uniref:AMP-binding protein n=1 Tax=Actinacidiphila soli TaxID=2487275 RepID=UPI000FCB748A|nr:AMP-binding protein [Actinacidiphila soli]
MRTRTKYKSAHIPSLSLWGGPAAPACLVDAFLSTAIARPDTLALIDGNREVTYRELVAWVRRINELLVDNGVRPEDRVAVTGPRGCEVVAAFLATVCVGATYVPLDQEYPPKRLAHMLSDSQAGILLYTGDVPPLEFAGVTLEIPPSWAVEGNRLVEDSWRPSACQADRPVYLIYTSGSTGWPKGVAIPHSCLDNMVQWQCDHSVRPDLRTGQFAPLNFDVCFQEILGTLCGGGTLVIMPEPLRQDPFALLDWLERNRIERIFLPYMALHMLSVASSIDDAADRLSLLEVNTAGEQLVCTPPIREFFTRRPDCRLANHYGQSESAMVASHILEGPSSTWPSLPPIGIPLPGCELLVDSSESDEAGVGELLVTGLPVSNGYLNQPELNLQRFVTVPTTPWGNSRAFRTGDLVRVENGVVHFLARLDHDVKIRGIRVNLLEVDAWLLDQPGVSEAVCVAVRSPGGSRQLRAAIALDDDRTDLNSDALLAALAEVLPAVAVPLSLTVLPELPRTASGKVDREAVADRIGRHTS